MQTIKYYDIYPSTKNKDIDNIVVYIGSSNYDTKEMTVLIDGIISDCKEAGIDVDYYSKEIKKFIKGEIMKKIYLKKLKANLVCGFTKIILTAKFVAK